MSRCPRGWWVKNRKLSKDKHFSAAFVTRRVKENRLSLRKV